MPLPALQPYLPNLQHPSTRTTLAATATALTILLLPRLLARAIRSYNGFLALGPGGIPHNLFGWLAQACLRPFVRSDLSDPSHYSHPPVLAASGPLAGSSFLGSSPLPERRGAPPVVPGYVAPQRQVTERADAETGVRMQAFVGAVAGENQGLLEVAPSGLEGQWMPALWLRGAPGRRRGSVPGFLGMTKGEIVHVHAEGSTHVTLSPADAAEVLRKGWGLRHPMSGVRGWLPWSYVLVYAPRDREEFEVWMRLVVASCSFVVSSADGQAKEIKYVWEDSEW